MTLSCACRVRAACVQCKCTGIRMQKLSLTVSGGGSFVDELKQILPIKMLFLRLLWQTIRHSPTFQCTRFVRAQNLLSGSSKFTLFIHISWILWRNERENYCTETCHWKILRKQIKQFAMPHAHITHSVGARKKFIGRKSYRCHARMASTTCDTPKPRSSDRFFVHSRRWSGACRCPKYVNCRKYTWLRSNFASTPHEKCRAIVFTYWLDAAVSICVQTSD